jgi:glutamate formiminotransferase
LTEPFARPAETPYAADAVVECVPNFSEGRRPEVIEEIVLAARGFEGVSILDVASDPDHNRTVVTMVGAPAPVARAVVAMTGRACALIDMERQHGAHPRVGAMDVIPFIPALNMTKENCVALAREVGREIAETLGIPVYLYGEAASSPERRSLSHLRRGEYEALRTAIAEADRRPDFGPAATHPTAGATIVGARAALVAFNINLGTEDLFAARTIARAIRESSGGLPAVMAKAVALADRGMTQVTMNLTDYRVTSPLDVLDAVSKHAADLGVPIVESEIIGLVPLDVLVDLARRALKAGAFTAAQVLETRLGRPS